MEIVGGVTLSFSSSQGSGGAVREGRQRGEICFPPRRGVEALNMMNEHHEEKWEDKQIFLRYGRYPTQSRWGKISFIVSWLVSRARQDRAPRHHQDGGGPG